MLRGDGRRRRARIGVVTAIALLPTPACVGDGVDAARAGADDAAVEALVRDHARAWMTGDTALARRILHEDARFAYPRRRVDRDTWISELAALHEASEDVRVYVHQVLVDGDAFAVEWQFASTDRATGVRTAVGDAIIGAVRDGRIVLWKEYLDGRVFALQRSGELPLDEGLEPHPWPEVP